jgi:hypothetical protein
MPQRAPSHPATSLYGLHGCSHGTGDEGKREPSQPVKSHVQEPPVPGTVRLAGGTVKPA